MENKSKITRTSDSFRGKGLELSDLQKLDVISIIANREAVVHAKKEVQMEDGTTTFYIVISNFKKR